MKSPEVSGSLRHKRIKELWRGKKRYTKEGFFSTKPHFPKQYENENLAAPFLLELQPPKKLPNDIEWLYPQKDVAVMKVVEAFLNKSVLKH